MTINKQLQNDHAQLRYYYLHILGGEGHQEVVLPVKNELETELAWAQSRPMCQALGREPALCLSDPDPFTKCLTWGEEQFRCSYEHSHPGQVWQLNQNPDSDFGAASSNGFAFPTITANAHMLFTDCVKPARWLAGSEALAMQSFPVVPGLWGIDQANFPRLCSFNVANPKRTSRQMLAQAGNSMNVQCMTVLALHGFLSWNLKQLPPLMANIRLSRSAVRAARRTTTFDVMPPPTKRFRTKQAQEE